MKLRALMVVSQESRTDPRTIRLDDEGPLNIGRAASNDLVLADLRVSANHASVRLKGDRLLVRDLGSRNGTWIVREGEPQRIPPEQDVEVAADALVRVATFDLLPCEMLGEGVVVSAGAGLHSTMDERHTPVPSESVPPEASLDATRALTEALRGTGLEQTWEAVLDGLIALGGADRGFLLSHADGQFLLRASRGGGSISQQFLERTLERGGTWSLRPSEELPDDMSSPSIAGFSPGVTLTGVRFLSRAGEPIAVGCLESSGEVDRQFEGGLAQYAELAGPLLETAIALNREHRSREALEARLQRERRRGESSQPGAESDRLVGDHPLFRAAVESVRRAAPANTTILLRGPSGSGKEELAHLVHSASRRRDHPMLVVNCAAIPEGLVESELFGHDKGSFTGAEQARAGAFATADGGTLFLDEIGDLPLQAQAKILRVIETGEVVRVGGSRKRVDVRLVAATHRDLEEMVRDGDFREDLYFRLRVIEVSLPSLAERPEDIPLLTRHFMDQLRRPDGRRLDGLSARAAQVLSRYSWPGNVREIRNVVERAVVLDRDGILDTDDLPAEIASGASVRQGLGGTSAAALCNLPWGEARDAFDELYFRTAWDRSDRDVGRTAETTGVEKRTLYNKIKRYELPRR